MRKDLMYKDDIQDLVADAYRDLDAPGGPGTRFYRDEQLGRVPEGTREWSLGVGNPLMAARLDEGDVVADLGCGGGVDTLLAADRVGSTGRAVGVDMLAEMVDRARRYADEAGIATSRSSRPRWSRCPCPMRSSTW